MSLISYPAVFHIEDKKYWVEFPDLPGCFSDGNSLEKAYENSKDALYVYLDESDASFTQTFRKPSKYEDVKRQYEKEIVLLIDVDSLNYGRKYLNKAVKKTLSIPQWLNDAANKENINFSSILQEALIKKLNIK